MPRLNQLPGSSPLVDADIFVVMQSGVTRKMTWSQIFNEVSAHVVPGGAVVPEGLLKGVLGGFNAAVAGTDFPGLDTPNIFIVPQTLPVKDKGGQVFNVKAYGAVGDNSNDDTSSIQAAIDAASTAVGGQVLFPAGHYKITSTLNLYSSIHLYGMGRASDNGVSFATSPGAWLMWAGGNVNTPMLLISSIYDVYIKNLGIMGGDLGPTSVSVGIQLQSAQNGSTSCEHISIEHCCISGCGIGILWGLPGSNPAQIDDVNISWCTFISDIIGIQVNSSNAGDYSQISQCGFGSITQESIDLPVHGDLFIFNCASGGTSNSNFIHVGNGGCLIIQNCECEGQENFLLVDQVDGISQISMIGNQIDSPVTLNNICRVNAFSNLYNAPLVISHAGASYFSNGDVFVTGLGYLNITAGNYSAQRNPYASPASIYNQGEVIWDSSSPVTAAASFVTTGGVLQGTWQSLTAYSLGNSIQPTVDNGHIYKCTTAGTSGSSQPTFNTGSGSTTTDGTVVWTENGPSPQWKPFGVIGHGTSSGIPLPSSSSGMYSVGQIFWNTAVTATSPIGWVCTVAGNPGTWVPFGFQMDQLGIGIAPLTKLDINVNVDQNARFRTNSGYLEFFVANDANNAYESLMINASQLKINTDTGGPVTFGGSIAAPTISGSAASIRSPLMFAIGDSITLNGQSTAVTGANQNFGWNSAQSYTLWASMISNGGLIYCGVAATGGFTTAQILATHLPVALVVNPGYCCVLGGINDLGNSVPLATIKANLISIWTQLANAGITPILMSLCPNNNYSAVRSTNSSPITQLNEWIRRQARINGWPFVDNYTPLCDTGTGGYYQATSIAPAGPYNVDDTHPNGAGAKLIGQGIADALAGITARWEPFLYTNNIDNLTTLTNPLLLTDSNSDGIPDNWFSIQGTITPGTTYQLLTNGSVTGNYWQAQRGTDDVQAKTTVGISISVGDRIYFACKAGATVTTGGNVQILCVTNNGEIICGFQGWNTSIPDGQTLAFETVIPSGTTGGFALIEIGAFGASGTQVRIGQVTLLNLTTGQMV